MGLSAAALLLAGCSGTEEGASDGSTTEAGGDATSQETDGEAQSSGLPEPGIIGADDGGEPVDGGTLTYAAWVEAGSLNPVTTIPSGTTGGTEMAAVFDVLVQWDPATGEFVPSLADSLESNDDASEWTLGLRDGVTFSDGTPLDAQAVVDSIQYYIDNGGGDAGMWERNVESFEATDDATVTFTLTGPWPGFPYLLAVGAGMIMAPAAYSGEEFTPIGAGAFTLESYAAQEELVLTARDDYWGDGPHLDQIRVVYLGDDQTRLESLRSGEVDSVFLRDPALVEEAVGSGLSGYLNMASMGTVFVINANEGRPGADPRVRRAIAHAVDAEVLHQRVEDGAGLATKAVFAAPSPWSSDVEPLPYDPEQARALVEEAKADSDWDGSLTFLDGSDPTSQETALTFEALLEDAGFDVETETAATISDQTSQILVDQDYDVGGWGLSWRDSGTYNRMFVTMHQEGSQTLGMATTDEMSALIDDFKVAEDDTARQEIAAQIQEQWNEDVPAVPYGPTFEFQAWSDAVHGVEGTHNSIALLDQAWVDG